MREKNVRKPPEGVYDKTDKIKGRMNVMHDKRQFFIRIPREFELFLKLDNKIKYVAELELNHPIPTKDPLKEAKIFLRIKKR